MISNSSLLNEYTSLCSPSIRLDQYPCKSCFSGSGFPMPSKGLIEQVKLIAELGGEERNMEFKIIDTSSNQKEI